MGGLFHSIGEGNHATTEPEISVPFTVKGSMARHTPVLVPRIS